MTDKETLIQMCEKMGLKEREYLIRWGKTDRYCVKSNKVIMDGGGEIGNGPYIEFYFDEKGNVLYYRIQVYLK